MKKSLLLVAMSVGVVSFAAPVHDGAAVIAQDDASNVTITYGIKDEPAIVTVDIQTNSPIGWLSIDQTWLTNVTGDVNKKVDVGTDKKIFWKPADTIPGRFRVKDVRAVVTLHATNAPPDYVVLDLSVETAAGRDSARFYPNAEQIPLGVTNDIYKTDYLVMRKIPAAGITWRMGAGVNESPLSSDDTLHLVTLPEDYYMAVYEMTQGQMRNIGLSSVITGFSSFINLADSDTRPVEGVSWLNIRSNDSWPSKGHELGQYTYFKYIKNKVGDMQFDLPTESQWEYACRAGTKTKYNNGDNYGIDAVAWYNGNCTNKATQTAETHPVGMKESNPWGLYDMIGNVREWCLDYYKQDYGMSDTDYDKVNYSGPTACDNGLNNNENNARVLRGGSYKNNSLDAKSAARSWGPVNNTKSSDIGFRVCCPVVYPL